MKLALLSDIHGNYVALEECLKYIGCHHFDGIVFLGDYITDCPYPRRTIALVRQAMEKYETWCVRGNREDYMLRHRNHPDEWAYNSRTGNLLNTYSGLTEGDLTFLGNMPVSQNICLPDCTPIAVCHGSPDSTKEILTENSENAKKWLSKIETDYLFCGHTHRLFIYEYNGKKLISCGSVGLPINHQNKAQFAQIEYTGSGWETVFVSLPYNVGALLRDFETSGIYEKSFWWAKVHAKCLQTGIDYPLFALQRALEISRRNSEELSEAHWKQAANELGIE